MNTRKRLPSKESMIASMEREEARWRQKAAVLQAKADSAYEQAFHWRDMAALLRAGATQPELPLEPAAPGEQVSGQPDRDSPSLQSGEALSKPLPDIKYPGPDATDVPPPPASELPEPAPDAVERPVAAANERVMKQGGMLFRVSPGTHIVTEPTASEVQKQSAAPLE